ncbi:MAG: HD domain-containing phosphohydrolase [Planctomycetota bacterium]
MLPVPPPPPNILRLLDVLHCGAALVDRQGHYAHLNARLADMLGRPAADLLGHRVRTTYSDPADQDRLAQLIDFEHPIEGEFFLERPDGHRTPVVFAGQALPADPPAPPEYLVITVFEIAQQKQALEDVADLSDTVLEQALRLRGDNHLLEERVRQRTAELHDANMTAITMLAIASEARDEDTGNHVKRIEAAAHAVALEMGLPAPEAEQIGYSAILHDIGKIHVPDHILKKPGRLTEAERHEMQQHTVIGQRILSDNPFFAVARQIARSHHENHDGTGYPDRLAGDDIPLPARITHVVDVFDALSSPRVYKDAWPCARARQAILDGRGSAFHPDVVDAFLRYLDRQSVPAADAEVDVDLRTDR